MNKNLLPEEIRLKLIECVKTHYKQFQTDDFNKSDSEDAAIVNANRTYENLEQIPIKHEVHDKHEQGALNIREIEINEIASEKTGKELLNNILSKAETQIYEWLSAIHLASLYIEYQKPLPLALRDFSINALKGNIKKPTTGHSKKIFRNTTIISCIHWIVTDSPYFSFLIDVGFTEKIPEYARGNSDTRNTVCGIVQQALEEIGVIVGYESIVNIWKENKLKNR